MRKTQLSFHNNLNTQTEDDTQKFYALLHTQLYIQFACDELDREGERQPSSAETKAGRLREDLIHVE